MKKIILLSVLALSFYSAPGQLKLEEIMQSEDDYRHIISHSELDTGIYESGIRVRSTLNNDSVILFKARPGKPATIGTYIHLFISKYGEREFNRILGLSPYKFIKEYNSENNPMKEYLMSHMLDYNGMTDDLSFKYDGNFYVVTYEPMSFKSKKIAYEKRELNLYKWMGNHKWKKINNKPIPHDTIPTNKYDIDYSISTFHSEVYNMNNRKDLNYDVTAMIVPVFYTYKKKKMMEVTTYKGDVKTGTKTEMRKVSRRGKYSQLMLFIKTENGFDIRVRPIKPKNAWYSNSNNLPNGENYMGIEDGNTIYFHLKSKKRKEDGNRTIPSETLKVEYNILTDETKFIKRE